MLLHDAAAVFQQCQNTDSIDSAFGGIRHAAACRSAPAGVRQRCSTALIMGDPRAAMPLSSSPPATGGTSAAAPRHTLAPRSAAETAAAAAAEIVGTGTDATSKTANASVHAQTASEEDTAACSGQVGGWCMLQVHACMAHASARRAVLTCKRETCCRTEQTLTATTTCFLPSCSDCSYRFPHYGCDAIPLSRYTHWFGALGLRC